MSTGRAPVGRQDNSPELVVTIENSYPEYDRAQFGQRLRLGTAPAMVVVDLEYGFTDPAYALGADLSDEITATRALLDVARGLKVPVFFTVIAYASELNDVGVWLEKSPALGDLLEGTRATAIDERLAAVGLTRLEELPRAPRGERRGLERVHHHQRQAAFVALGGSDCAVDGALKLGAVSKPCQIVGASLSGVLARAIQSDSDLVGHRGDELQVAGFKRSGKAGGDGHRPQQHALGPQLGADGAPLACDAVHAGLGGTGGNLDHLHEARAA